MKDYPLNIVHLFTNLPKVEIPKNIHEGQRKPKWRVAIEDKIRALKKSGTWKLSNLPKWAFNVKYKPATRRKYKLLQSKVGV